MGVFTIRTASGDMGPASLCGMPKRRTYAKTYQLLKTKLADINCMDICDLQECGPEHGDKLEKILATLSDAQFDVFVKILASSPRARHRMYLSICAMIPGELENMQNIYPEHAWHAPVPSPFAFPITQPISIHGPEPKTDGLVHSQPDGRRCLQISFNIDDVDGARDLLVKLGHKMSQIGLDPYSSSILFLQQFANLCQTVSKQLLKTWASKYKWPESWKGIDEVTLDLRRAYAPDGIYLPSEEWLQDLKESRDATPSVFMILAPTATLEEEARDPWNPQDDPFDPDVYDQR